MRDWDIRKINESFMDLFACERLIKLYLYVFCSFMENWAPSDTNRGLIITMEDDQFVALYTLFL